MVSKNDLILVTGGGGFIGSNAALALAESGYRVVVSDWFGDDSRWHNIAPAVIEDIVRPENLSAWMKTHNDSLGGIVHMGAISATTERDVDKIIENNIRLSLDLWEHSCNEDTAFVYASSAATYGDGSSGFVDDDSQNGLAKLAPLNPYGWSKHFVDRRIAADVASGRKAPSVWAGLKFFNVFGPRESHKGGMRSVIHQIWPHAARGETVRLFKSDNPDYADGGQLRDFIHVDDCVHVIRAALSQDSLAGVFNVGTGQARSFEDLARATFRAVGCDPKIEYIDMPDKLRGRYQYFTQADTMRLKSQQLAPNFKSLEDGIADYIDWLRANPEF